MFEALVKDKQDFVWLMADNGFNFNDFLTPEKLERLYITVSVVCLLLVPIELLLLEDI